MTERKFTPPTEFFAEYVDGNGDPVLLFRRGPLEEFPLIGFNSDGEQSWTECGRMFLGANSPYDLHDIPKRISTWHNVYSDWFGSQCSSRSDADEVAHRITHAGRLCVYRIERDEDGGNFEMFKEEV